MAENIYKKRNTEELIIDAKAFFNNYKKNIGESIRKGKKVVSIDFNDLSSASPSLSEDLIANPEEVLQLLETALEETGLINNPRIRFLNFPDTQKVRIRTIRANHLNQMIFFEGLVRQASEVRPQVVNAKFECPSCGTIISVLQIDKKFREPTRCSCGRKGDFNLLSKTMVDAQRLVIEESPESLVGGEQPRRMSVFLKEDLVEPGMEEKTTPGSKVRVLGILKEVPVPLPTGSISTRFDLAVEANNIIALESTYEDLDINEEDEKQIQELAEDPELFKKLRESVAPSIWGYNQIKEALVLQMFGGVRKISPDGTTSRGDVHIFLIGDPGVAKSVTLKFISNIAPKGRYIVGKAASLDYNEPLLIRERGKQKFVKIGEFVDSHYISDETGFVKCNDKIEALSLNLETLKLEWRDIRSVFRHNINQEDNLLKFTLETGRKITVTKDHSIFCIENGKIKCKNSQDLKKGDYVIIPKNIPSEMNQIPEEIAKFLGYFIAEGHLYKKDGSYKIQFTLNKNEMDIASEINYISEKYFNKPAKITSHGNKAIRLTIYGKESYLKLCSLLGKLAHKKANEKGIPEIIVNSDVNSRIAFFDSYIKGDAGVTVSEKLMSELLYLKLQDNVIASCLERKMKDYIIIEGREVFSKNIRYDLIAPVKRKEFKNKKINFPIECLSPSLKSFFKRKKDQKYSRINLESFKNTIIERILTIYNSEKLSGKELRKIYGENSLEYFINHPEMFRRNINGREIEISLTDDARDIAKEFLELKKLLNSDIAFVKIKNIEEVKSKSNFVYDVSTPENENFIAGFGGVLCHNTGAGITATVVRDEFLKGWSLEAGAMVLANKGVICIDEIEKMDATDRSAMHEALEQQTVTISKANVQATLSAQTSVLAAGNPKFGRFEPNIPISQQIDLPPALLNRFDLIFVLRDLPNKIQDDAIATHVLNIHQRKDKKSDIERDLFRKYVAYAKQKVEPKLTDEAVEEIKDFYIKMRNAQTSGEGASPISISARQLQGLIRLAEAHAKSRLSPKVEREDSKIAIDLTKYYLMQVGYDHETKRFDIDRFTSRVSSSERNKIMLLKETIKKMEEEHGKMIPINVLQKKLESDFSIPEFEEAIEKLKKSGDLFQPKAGYIQDVQSR